MANNDEHIYQHLRYIRRQIGVYKQYITKTRQSELHFHDAHEIMLIKSGRYRLYAPQAIYEGNEPCIVLLKLGTYHGCVKIECEAEPFACYVLNYHQSVVDDIPRYMFDGDELFENDVMRIPADKETISFLDPLFNELAVLVNASNGDDPPPVQTYGYFISVLNVVVSLIRSGKGRAYEATTDSEYYISKVIKIVMESIERGEDVSVSELADRFFVSRSKLSKDFSRTVGITLKQMIDSLRLERIKKMLKAGMDNKQIAAQCGFTNDSYFIQFFDKHMNMSPGEYRRLYSVKV